MPFLVEDGTGLAGATALASVEFADGYFTDRAVVGWTGLTAPAKQAALIKATDYIETRWGALFKGCRQFEVQALSFPRLHIDEDDVVPVAIKKATAEYALRAHTQPLAPDPAVDSSGRAAIGTRKKVGPIETETMYASEGVSARPQLLRAYPAADMLLCNYIRPSGGVVR